MPWLDKQGLLYRCITFLKAASISLPLKLRA